MYSMHNVGAIIKGRAPQIMTDEQASIKYKNIMEDHHMGDEFFESFVGLFLDTRSEYGNLISQK